MSVALTVSYGRWPYVNSSHRVTPAQVRQKRHGNTVDFTNQIHMLTDIGIYQQAAVV